MSLYVSAAPAMGRVWIKSQLLPIPLITISQLSTLVLRVGKWKHFYLPNTLSFRYWNDLNSGINQLHPIEPQTTVTWKRKIWISMQCGKPHSLFIDHFQGHHITGSVMHARLYKQQRTFRYLRTIVLFLAFLERQS